MRRKTAIRTLLLLGLFLGASPAGLAVAPPTENPSPCRDAPAFGELDFWLGEWEVWVGERLAGTNRIEEILGGCALVEDWTAAGGGRGKSLFYYHPVESRWKQVWVTEDPTRPGGVKEKVMVDRLEDGGVRFQGEIRHPERGRYLDRTTLRPLEGDRVRQVIEVSTDGGETWRVVFDATYVRPGERSGERDSGPVEGVADEETGILFLGNSLTYANDMPGILRELLEAGEAGPVRIRVLAGANLALQDHWSQRGVRKILASGEWDLVVVQQGPSATEGRPSLLHYSRRLAKTVEEGGGELALYMVWPARARFRDLDGVIASYWRAAERAGARLFPVGAAWGAVWEEDPSVELYGPDGFHPSPAGSYLAALVIYEGITGRSPLGLPSSLETDSGVRIDLPLETVELLQRSAAKTNREWGDGSLGR